MKAERRLLGLTRIGNETTNEIDEKVGGAAVARMLNLGNVLELVNNSLDNGAFSQQNLVENRHELVLHV